MKLCLAATNKHWLNELDEVDISNYLCSYFYLERQRDMRQLFTSRRRPFMIVDSGAHSFHEGQSMPVDFVEKYINFLEENKEYIDAFVELDVEGQYGLDQVEKWRKEITDQVGPPIVVWHRNRGKQYWIDMCKEYDYVGFSGFVKVGGEPEVPTKYLPWFLSIADKYDAKVHGFGFTKHDLLDRIPFYSVDSSSWLAGNRYGMFFMFNGSRMISMSKTAFAERYGRAYNKLDWKKTARMASVQWKAYSDYLERRKI